MQSFFGLADDFREPGRTVFFDSESVTALVVTGLPSVVPWHLHEHHEELGYVLEDSGTPTVGDLTHELQPGVTFSIARNTPHRAEFTSPFRILSWFTPREDLNAPDRVEIPGGAA